MSWLIEQIIQKRIWLFLLTGSLTLWLSFQILNIQLNGDFTSYLRQDDPLVQQFNYLGEVYASKSIALVLVESDDIFTEESLQLIANLSKAYENVEGISYTTSLTNVLDFRNEDEVLAVGPLIPDDFLFQNTEKLKQLKDYVLSKELYVGDLVSKDGKLAVIVVRFGPNADEFTTSMRLLKASEPIDKGNANVYFGGMPFLISQMIILIQSSFTFLEPLMIGVMLLLLFIGFRKWGGVILPMLIVLLSVLWLLGIMSWLGLSIDLLSGIVPVVLVAMASADGIHVMRLYYQKREEGFLSVNAMKATFQELGTPIVITTLTTMVGFLSLSVSGFDVIRQFGFMAALGVFLALLATFIVFPALSPYFKNRPYLQQVQQKTFWNPESALERWGSFVFQYKRWIILGGVGLVVTSLILIPRIQSSVDWTLCLQKGSNPHEAEMILRREFGGTLPLQILVKAETKDPMTLKAMRYVERYMESLPTLNDVQSISTVLSEMNYVMNSRYQVPDKKDQIANLWALIEDEELMEQLVRKDHQESLINAKINSWDTQALTQTVDEVNQFLSKIPEDLSQLQENLVQQVTWILQSYQMSLPAESILQVTQPLFQVSSLTKAHTEILRQRLHAYLLSDEAEVEIESKSLAEQMTQTLINQITTQENFEASTLVRELTTILPDQDSLDIEDLANSLMLLSEEALGQAKVTEVYEALVEETSLALPPFQEREFRRSMLGVLWNTYQKSTLNFSHLTLETTGLAAVLKQMEEELTPTQLQSLLSSLIAVIFFLTLMFRSVSLGFMGVIPIGITILVNFAVMAVLDVGLDSFTAMVASVAIGLGIDTDVHFISSFRQHFQRLNDELSALKATLKTTGVSILINTFTVGVGFSVLLLASGQHMQRFGGLTSLTIFLSAFLTLTLLPAVMLTIKPAFLKQGAS